MKFVILMTGHTCSLKTTTASNIGKILDIPVIRTHQFGTITRDGKVITERRDERYNAVYNVVKEYMQQGISFVVDGSFSREKWRCPLYKLATNNEYEILFIKCECRDKALVKERLKKRCQQSSLPESEICLMNYYYQHIREFESIYTDEFQNFSVIEFDTSNFKLKITKNNSPLAEKIYYKIYERLVTEKLR